MASSLQRSGRSSGGAALSDGEKRRLQDGEYSGGGRLRLRDDSRSGLFGNGSRFARGLLPEGLLPVGAVGAVWLSVGETSWSVGRRFGSRGSLRRSNSGRVSHLRGGHSFLPLHVHEHICQHVHLAVCYRDCELRLPEFLESVMTLFLRS